MADYQIKLATAADALFFRHLADSETEALGFCPAGMLAEKIEQGKALTAWLNGQRAGMLVTNGIRRSAKIHFTAIVHDARRRQHATALVEAYRRRLAAAGCDDLRLRCRSDLEANLFWQSIGFEIIGNHWPHARQVRPLIQYRLAISPQNFLFPPDTERLARPQDRRLFASPLG